MSTRGLPEQVGDLPKIGRPAASALLAIGVTTLDQVAGMREAELLAVHGVGPKAVRILREALDERGRGFRAGDAGAVDR
ncbi:helix-hairpin-helix domain-containing protein [Agrococcus sp. Marseille-P2731]|uniref:helix-hairpin-helix domain-containing protein n=1 Tax=Agrococcus sp. Marseille-P2731 TaxID=1841862 RepID=UPI00092FFCA5|nr:helix-hairpin-helix domain-containing protein [Agrococcus sp. Marseille-P2731]